MGRRLLFVVLVALAVGIPAVVLRAFCVGKSCREVTTPDTRVPYCSLSPDLRGLIASGFRDGRSPNVLAVAGEQGVRGSTEVPQAAWPSLDTGEGGSVPLVFAGTGTAPDATVPSGTTLDAVAPTVADIIGLHRPHPGVRSGTSVTGVADGEAPRLVLLVAWKGVGTDELEEAPNSWPQLAGLANHGAATQEARPGSLPVDPAAVLTSIGTGALPRDHGITGTLVRNERGSLVKAWGPEAPFSVIAALGDDLDDRLGQRPRVGVVGSAPSDRGLIGSDWYVEHDEDDAVLASTTREQSEAATRLLASGYGQDDVPDLLAVALDGDVGAMDDALGEIVRAADRITDNRVLVVVTATGSTQAPAGAISADVAERDVEARLGVDAVEATAVGGMFLDQDVLASSGLSVDRVVTAYREVRAADGSQAFADVFPSIAVTFARYC